MVWVRSEHGGVLATVSTWLCALFPWNVAYTWNLSGVSLLFVRFPFAEMQFSWDLSSCAAIRGPLSAFSLQSGQTIVITYRAWAVGTAVLTPAVLFSLVYYLHDEQVEAGPVDPVWAPGGLPGVVGAVLAAATYLLATYGIPGIPFPLGVVVSLVLVGVLLIVSRA